MREIKFRVWDTDEKRFITKSSLQVEGNDCCLVLHLDGDLVDIAYDRDERHNEYPVEQFTGLFDKNGKEIYEGDIVIQREEVKNPRTRESYKKPRFIERKGTIVFQDGCFDFKSERYSGQIRCYMGYRKGNIQLEIIGNIHENGELLVAK